jgi:glutathione peroxidase
LHHQFEDVQVLGFPCNQFGGQEPGTEAEICEFVATGYDVDFPMFAKVDVNGDGTCELYQYLKSEQPGDGATADIAWNFEKFLVDREGNVVRRFSPLVTPAEVAEVIPEYL